MRLLGILLGGTRRLAVHIDGVILVVHVAAVAVGVIDRFPGDRSAQEDAKPGEGRRLPAVVVPARRPPVVVGVAADHAAPVGAGRVDIGVAVACVDPDLVAGRVAVIDPRFLVVDVVGPAADVDVAADIDVGPIPLFANVRSITLLVDDRPIILLANVRSITLLVDDGAVVFLANDWPVVLLADVGTVTLADSRSSGTAAEKVIEL